MRIFHIIPSLKRAGAESQVVSLSNELILREGFEVEIFTFNKNNDFHKELNSDIKIYTGYGLGPIGMFFNIMFIIRLIKINKFDVIHGHMFHAVFINRILSIFHSAKILETFHCSVKNISNKQKLLLKITRNKKYYTSFVSNETMRLFRKENLFFEGSYIPNMIDRKFFEHKSEFYIESNKWISVGRLVHEKNHKLLIEACSILKDRGKEYKVDIYGDGYLKKDLACLIKSYNLEEYVFLKGGSKNIENVYKHYDYFVSTSSIESFGIVFLEAMSQRLPILSTKNEGAIELLENQDVGYLVDSNAYELADKMSFIMDEEKANIERNVESSFDVLIKFYHPQVLTDRWVELYKGF